jgi:hypothetical protein
LLHDDFYDERGVAMQPEGDVESPEQFPMPLLSEAATDVLSLFDFSMSRWFFEEDLAERWRSLPTDVVLNMCVHKFEKKLGAEVDSLVLQIAGATLGAQGAALVRNAWARYPDVGLFWPLVKASSACLPFIEAFNRAQSALAAMDAESKRSSMGALAYFRHAQILEWIESNACAPVTEAWGHLAAASAFSWIKAQTWLSAGRPLSLIALDALKSIAVPPTPLLRAQCPLLKDPPDELTFRRALKQYVTADPAPRIKQRVESLIAQSATLTRLSS